MTAQWQHRYITETGEVILSEETPFVPQDHGLQPQSFTTACQRGYVCEFRIRDNRCDLHRLLIRMQPLAMDRGIVAIEEYPPLNTIGPRSFFLTSSSWVALYENIDLEFKFVPDNAKIAFTPPHGLPKKDLARWKQQQFKRISLVNPFDTKKQADMRSPVHRSPRMKPFSQKSKTAPEKGKKHYPFRDPRTDGYDIIGDIHGHADELEALLNKLGYSLDGRKHPKRRRLIFLGDFIDRGPKNRRTIEIIRTLVRTDRAYAVMGNHEYNAICYHTRNKQDSGYLRPHTRKNKNQHQAFLADYPDLEERDQVIRWFQRLPLFLDLLEIRVVHACWDQSSSILVDEHYDNQLTTEFLHRSVTTVSQEFLAIETLLKGPEYTLGPGLSFLDSDGNSRSAFRLRWWKKELQTLGEAAILPHNALKEHLNTPLRDHCREQPITPYPADAPPVFFGHYAALPVAESFTVNTACLDYNIIKGQRLACLRWHKREQNKRLDEMEIVTVDFLG